MLQLFSPFCRSVTECSVMDPDKRRRTDREQFPLLMDWMIVFKKVAAVVICKKLIGAAGYRFEISEVNLVFSLSTLTGRLSWTCRILLDFVPVPADYILPKGAIFRVLKILDRLFYRVLPKLTY